MAGSPSRTADAGTAPVPLTAFQRTDLRVALSAIVGADSVITDPDELVVYEYDGIGVRGRPDAVAFPRSTQHVQAIMKYASANGLPVTPRGAGTGLSGGALALEGGILLVMTRMNNILEVNLDDGYAVVEPGVVNLDLSTHLASSVHFYAPDPSSQKACTLGGNIAENSGGPHCLAYGVTTNHVLALDVVLADGSLLHLGSVASDQLGYDLRGFFVGSEGTLGVVTKMWVRILPEPEAIRTMVAAFQSTERACEAVSAIIGAGLVPAALEVIDALTIKAVQSSIAMGYPADAGAVLLIEVDGLREQVVEDGRTVEEICLGLGALSVVGAETAAERDALWAGRKGALGALGRLAPNYVLQDGVVPRSKLPQMLRFIAEQAEKFDLQIANVFHAGDGNLHPCLLFDARDPAVVARVHDCNYAIMRACVDAGGTITGEHGVGIDKASYMPWIFSERDLLLMVELRRLWNPGGLLNPGKVLPVGLGCGEARGSLDGFV